MNTVGLFESMAALSTEMVDAAQANDWDRLAALELRTASLRDEIGRVEPEGRQGDLTEAEQLHKAALVLQILDDHREIRRHVEPWLESTRKLLSGGVRERAVRAAYGP